MDEVGGSEDGRGGEREKKGRRMESIRRKGKRWGKWEEREENGGFKEKGRRSGGNGKKGRRKESITRKEKNRKKGMEGGYQGEE